jgi:putative radical SAM enzyme (TIGR03279 family)
MVKIICVEERSLAKKAGIKPLDMLVAINGNEISDVLDYRFYLAERLVTLTLMRDGDEYSVKIKKGEYDDIGLEFESALMDEKHSCRNGCIFCFIDQNPEGMREPIYFKDDDSRLSFIHGNYITLTNMYDKDIERIIKMRISPVNVSIHTTNPELRVKMMKNKRSGDVLRYLDDFKRAGLSMCGQIVLCKGVNDGEELLRSLRDLSAYYPEMGSVSIVPAGLTKHRDGLYPLTDFTEEEAGEVIDMIDSVANEQLKKYGSRQFFAADEFYLKAKRPLPDSEYYEDYPQIENGVGMLRSFSDEFGMATEDVEYMLSSVQGERRVTVVTGVAAYPMISDFGKKISELCPKIKVNAVKIINKFFGESITVSGLLTGKDIYEQLSGVELGDELLIPESALRSEDRDFLCGMTLSELQDKLGVKVTAVGNDGYQFAEAVFGITE